jgi:exonuclease SbcD
VVEVVSRDGSERAQVAVLPWVGERMMYGIDEIMGMEEAPHSAYAENLPRLLNALCAGFEPGAIHLLAGHLFVSGTRPGGSERELTLGQLFAITAQSLPAVAQYIALGHVHRPQEVTGSLVPARYAGSLLQLDFGEREQEKSVVIVEVGPGVPAVVRTRPLASGRSLLDVRGTMEELRQRAVDAEAYLRVTVVCGGPAPGLADAVREILPNALEVRLEYERAPGESEPGEARRLSPRQLFERYYNVRHGAGAAPELMTQFDELLEEVSGAPADA